MPFPAGRRVTRLTNFNFAYQETMLRWLHQSRVKLKLPEFIFHTVCISNSTLNQLSENKIRIDEKTIYGHYVYRMNISTNRSERQKRMKKTARY